MHVKKQREREILDLVYTGRTIQEIIASERPDFLIRGATGAQFGVEVAEIYDSQTTARLERIPEYAIELLSGGGFRHKDDIAHTSVGKIDILDKNDDVVDGHIDAIIREIPTTVDCARALAALIETKTRKLVEPASSLTHINLILRDRAAIPEMTSMEPFYRLYFIPELIRALSFTYFREVFFVATTKGITGYVPLKLLMFLAELYFFNAAYVSLDGSRGFPITAPDTEVFGSYFATLVTEPVLFRQEPAGDEVIYGECGLLVTPDNSVKIRGYHDNSLPNDARAVSTELAENLNKEFIDKLATFKSSNTFVTSLFFPSEYPRLEHKG